MSNGTSQELVGNQRHVQQREGSYALAKIWVAGKGNLASTRSVEHASVHYCKSFKTRINKISFINIDVFVCCFFLIIIINKLAVAMFSAL